jgi:diphthine-ammonia ligase
MKFVALLSGGKDSCYNIMKCVEFGHELVCVAHIKPPVDFSGEELHSWMYQTAAHRCIPALAECLGVPLISRSISGESVSQGLEYRENERDEVEDMFKLLKDVKDNYPDVQGVSCGAIISTYQRLRVENVCGRLGLTPLTYLWQRDRRALLLEMTAAGVDARLVKVAGAGLSPEKHLGRSLSSLTPSLLRLHERFGLDLCGEGGEYETLVLDCPAFVKRLQLDATEVFLDEENSEVGNLCVRSWTVVEKSGPEPEAGQLARSQPPKTFHLPALLEVDAGQYKADGQPLLTGDRQYQDTSLASFETDFNWFNCEHAAASEDISRDFWMTQSPLFLGEEAVPAVASPAAAEAEAEAETELEPIVAQVKGVLDKIRLFAQKSAEGATMGDVCFVHLYLADMAQFQRANSVYCQYFGASPPSRSCVSTSLPIGTLVAADVLIAPRSHCRLSTNANPFMRRVLHVQSISEWAPLCIGPYSQCNVVGEALCFIAGQIPLSPGTMQMWPPAQVSMNSIGVDLTTSDVCPSPSASSHPLSAAHLKTTVVRLKQQLGLCVRNAYKVFEGLASPNRAVKLPAPESVFLSVTCYLSMSGLASSLGISNTACQKLLWSSIVPSLDDYASSLFSYAGFADESTSEEGDLDTEKDFAHRKVPLAFVGVVTLPQGALVEIETLACPPDSYTGLSQKFHDQPVIRSVQTSLWSARGQWSIQPGGLFGFLFPFISGSAAADDDGNSAHDDKACTTSHLFSEVASGISRQFEALLGALGLGAPGAVVNVQDIENVQGVRDERDMQVRHALQSARVYVAHTWRGQALRLDSLQEVFTAEFQSKMPSWELVFVPVVALPNGEPLMVHVQVLV